MEENQGPFSFIRRRHLLTQILSLLTMVSMLTPAGTAFATDEFFRQTKEYGAPDPFVQPDFAGGAFTETRTIAVPPGRNGLQPDVRLTYSNQATGEGSIVGYGWSLNIPYIERLNKLGVDNLYNQDRTNSFFYSSLSGELAYASSTAPQAGFSVLGLQWALPRISLKKLALLDSAEINAPSPQASTSSHPVSDSLNTLPAKDRSTLKGQAIAQLGNIAKTAKGDYQIEIQRMNPIEGGIEVFARVWDKNNRQIGFGRDGTVEIERFRIINPPILVIDPDGDILHEWRDDVTGELKQRRLREDLKEALLQSLAHTISVKKEKFSERHIETGKIGNTTTTVYPDAHAESTSVDGGVTHIDNNWNTAHDATAGNDVDANDTNADDDVRTQRYQTGSFFTIRRLFFLFDTSSIPDTDEVSSATYSVYVTGVNNDDNDGDDWLTVVQSTPASNTAIVSGDYDQAGAIDNPTEGTSDRKDLTSISSSAYLDFALNSTGIGWVSTTSITKLAVREGHDVIDSPFITGADRINRVSVKMADQAGTTNDPKLVVEHSVPPVGPGVSVDLEVESQTNPGYISTTSPRFSALHQNASTTALASSYQIQVTTSSTTWSSPYWDSGKLTLSSSTPLNVRTPEIIGTTTTFALDGTKYYWRIKLWDQVGTAGSWSTTTDFFTMKFNGEYKAKVESGDFLRYTYFNEADGSEYWVAVDKKGTEYKFGTSSGAQLNDATATNTYRWMLEKITDPNGNTVTYSYVKDGTQLYPYKINYGGNGESAGIYEVEFLRESRSDISTSTAYGFSVVTKQLIKEVLVRTNGQLTHRYVLSYTTGDNGVRSLLSSMQESGWDAASGTTTLPAVQFRYSTSTNGWTENTDGSKWVVPVYFTGGDGSDSGARMFDVNGDSLPDVIYRDSSNSYAYLNTGTSWESGSGAAPEILNYANSPGLRLGDINGDGFVDILRSHTIEGGASTKLVYLGGFGGWASESTRWVPPVYITVSSNGVIYEQGVQLLDVNGDGLADLTGNQGTYINDGSQWVQSSEWWFPETHSYLGDRGVRTLDVNGDGLLDIVVARNLSGDVAKKTYINTGSGWEESPWSMPFGYFVDGGDKGGRFVDANTDGLPDVAENSGSVYINTGSGWSLASTTFPTAPVEIGSGLSYDLGIQIDDVSGDGLADVIKSTSYNSTNVKKVWIKNGIKPDLLKEITNEKGGTISVGYQRTSQLAEDGTKPNASLQLSFDTVKTVANDPGFGGAIATTTYAYTGGLYYFGGPHDRQFAGFGTTTKTNALNYSIREHFHQGNGSDSAKGEYNDHIAKAGKPYLVEVLDGTTTSANLYSRTINKWARADFGDGRNFTKLIQTLKQVFDGDATSHRDTAASTTYSDTTGDAQLRVNYGEVSGNADGTFTDTGTDLASTTYSYAASSTQSAMSLLAREFVADQASTTVRDTRWYYDGLTLGSMEKGNQTKEEKLISGSTYASTTKSYNSYGLPTEIRDAIGHATTFVYDALNLYPATSTNALGYSRTFQYDYSSGKVATTTDENSRTIATTYDGLDRPLEEKQPDFTTPTTLVSKTAFTYTDSTSTPSSVLRRDHLSSATSTDLYTYVDGLGRTLQTKKEAESANGWIAKDWIYNNLGSLREESLPYFHASSANTTATSAAHLYSTYSYDPEGRITTFANALGTTTNTYSDWRLTVTDALANKKDLTKDAYGNLATVAEYGPTTATTTYTWNLLGKLTKITDASSNIRNFTYDSLGHLIGSEDLHASGDTGFGTTSHQYDLVGNLIQRYTPLGTAINYVYDALNRMTSEDATTTPALLDVAYRYDTCTNGVGRLCEVNANGAATTTYAYNPIGLTSTEARLVGGTWATTSTSYLRNGSLDTLTYPDSRQIAYVYNDAGDFNRVFGLAPASTTWHTLVDSTSYAPTGRPSEIDYGNNTKETYTYDQTKLYRLIRKLTVSTSTDPGSPEQLLFLATELGTEPLLTLTLEEAGSTYEELPLVDINLATVSTTTTGTNAVEAATSPDALISEESASTILERITPQLELEFSSTTEEMASSTPVVEQSSAIVADATTTLDISVADLPVALVPEQKRAHPVADEIKDLSAKERATRKGQAVAALGGIPKTPRGQYSIEIERMNPIDGGVEIFARAWDENDRQIGFGRDGTVEIERFRIINPPILVIDPDGDILHEWRDDVTGELKQRRLREDLKEALLQSLAHTISVKKEKFSERHIETGKIGNTTTTVYPDAHAESTSVDGGVTHIDNNWNTAHDATAGNDVDANDTNADDDVRTQRYQTGSFFTIRRLFFLFDTSSISDTDTVSSATYSVYVTGVNNDDNDGDDWLTVVQSSPASNTAIVSDDYDQAGAIDNPTEGTDDRKDLTNIATSAYLDFALNSTGVGWVSKTGITKLGVREGHDVIDSPFICCAADAINRVVVKMADQAGTASDPKLVVEHSFAAVGPSVSSGLQVELLTNPGRVATSNPRFSAVHENASTTAFADEYQIQVDTAGTFTSLYWDSGRQTLSSSTPQNVRTPQIFSTTTFPFDGTRYYWRIKLWDQVGTAGDWTTETASFTLSGGTTTLQDLRYTYDAVGNITNILDLSGTNAVASTSYQYDGLYRLTRASTTDSVTDWLQTFTYDVLGNLTNKSDVGAYTYAGTGFLNPHAASAIAGNSLNYDNAGNLLSYNGGSYFWNYRNRLVDTNNAGTTTAYKYDHNDQRVLQDIKRGAGATTTTSYFNRYYEASGATTTAYVFAPWGLLATVEGNGSATSTYIAHTDHLSGSNVMSDKDGALAQLSTYYPFGSIRQNEKPENDFNEKRKFIGEYYDDATSLSYLNARYYDGGNGKFISQDPVARDIGMMQKQPTYVLALNQVNGEVDQTAVLSDPQLLNSYSYSANNPITKSDPSGKCLPACAGVLAIPGVGQAVAIGAVAVVGSAALYYGTKAVLQSSPWGSRYGGQVQTLDPAKMGFGQPPTGPEDWLPNLPPNLPKWAKAVIGGLTVGSIVAETYEQYKDIKDKFTNPTDTTTGSNSKQQNGQQTAEPPPTAPASSATPSNTQNNKQGQTNNNKP